MAIVTELLDGIVHTYSDKGVKIHGGFPEGDYDEAYDPADLGRTYTETDIPVEDDELTDSEALYVITDGEYGKEQDDETE